MPSVEQEMARLKWLLTEGKVAPTDPCKLVCPKLEAKKRVKNTEGRTRLVVQLDTPATYSEFAAQFARYKELTGNPQIAFSLMLRLLAGLSDDSIKRLAADDAEKPSLGDA
jgi:hypothetical protein